MLDWESAGSAAVVPNKMTLRIGKHHSYRCLCLQYELFAQPQGDSVHNGVSLPAQAESLQCVDTLSLAVLQEKPAHKNWNRIPGLIDDILSQVVTVLEFSNNSIVVLPGQAELYKRHLFCSVLIG